jgi:hypothetical protein
LVFLLVTGSKSAAQSVGFPCHLQEMVAARRAVGVGGMAGSPAPAVRERRTHQYGDNLLAVTTPNFWLIFAHDALQPFICFQVW